MLACHTSLNSFGIQYEMSSVTDQMPISYPANVSFYNFTAIQPPDGHCEWKMFGYWNCIKEPFAFVLGIVTALQGLFGLVKSQRVAIGSRYMFSLLLGFGLASAGHTATLWNGFKKINGCCLSLMQAIIIIRLINTMKFPPFNNKPIYGAINSILLSTFGLYPVVVQVLDCSFDYRWMSWLSFDLIWLPILIIVIIIYVHRDKYPQWKTSDKDVFTLVFNAMVTCTLAYTFWLVDTFACSFPVALLNFYGLWLLLIGITFYYLTVLDAFLQSSWQNYKPVITRWPEKYIIVYVHIECDTNGTNKSQ